MAAKYYAVKKGRNPGIYLTWEMCQAQIMKYPGAVYKSFLTKIDAENFMKGPKSSQKGNTPVSEIKAYAYVDGSFNPKTFVYGYGGFLIDDQGEKHVLQGCGNDKGLSKMRNIAGEIEGAKAAILKAKELNLSAVIIYFDYQGIESWANQEWKTNHPETQKYMKLVRDARNDGLQIEFVKVKGHTGVNGNEEADRLAKQAVGVSF